MIGYLGDPFTDPGCIEIDYYVTTGGGLGLPDDEEDD